MTDYRRLALYTSVIFILPTTLVGGLLVGRWADQRWGTEPWLTMAGLLLGIAAAFLELFRILKRDRG
jgi:F0F1-type ATP synthase assembly protein I